MAKGGLLNQVPQIDLPTTMDCNVISIGGQTPEEYANLIAQKVTNKLGNPGTYGTGTIKLLDSDTIQVNKKILFDGLEWYVVGIDDSNIFALRRIQRIIYNGSLINNLKYSQSNIYSTIQLELNKMSNTAQYVMKQVEQDIIWQSKKDNYEKINDKMWIPTVKNISSWVAGINFVNKNSLKINSMSGPVFDSTSLNSILLLGQFNFWLADRYVEGMHPASGTSYYDKSASWYYNYEQILITDQRMNVGYDTVVCICLDKSKL